ncbi:unnamed protein product [Dovyalis caffra]|uniref:Uncharacterized protein n=1 Tax=Dovyalis caffra TaxID=77055 RepID=A0AAV1SRS9_9ROSI|nr:unnamed protein product [Dovyalis caffra]
MAAYSRGYLSPTLSIENIFITNLCGKVFPFDKYFRTLLAYSLSKPTRALHELLAFDRST